MKILPYFVHMLRSTWMQSSAEDWHVVPFGQLSVSLQIGPVKVVLHLRADIRLCLCFKHLLSDLCENPHRMYACNGALAVMFRDNRRGNFSHGRKWNYITITYTWVLISSYPDQERNKLQRQKIMSFIYPIYNHNWRNISTIYIYNKTRIRRNILTIKQNTSGSRSG
jgi:hypothetical protein